MFRIRKIPLWESATTINATAAITSEAIKLEKFIGDAHMIYVELAGSAPSVDITLSVGDDPDATFGAPYDTSGTILNVIQTTLVTTRWIQYTPALAPYFKLVITGDGANGADTTAKAYLYLQEDI